jgi:hypothetical protein
MLDGTFVVFVGTGIAILLIVYRFNWKTHVLVKRIQEIAQQQGGQWPFWRDRERIAAFLLNPASLRNSFDSVEIAGAKGELLAHRRSLRRTLFITVGVMVLGAMVAVAVPIAVALRRGQ